MHYLPHNQGCYGISLAKAGSVTPKLVTDAYGIRSDAVMAC